MLASFLPASTTNLKGVPPPPHAVLLGFSLPPKWWQEMTGQANDLTGNTIRLKCHLWGTLRSPECFRKERVSSAATENTPTHMQPI